MKSWAGWLVCALLVGCAAPRVPEAPRDVQYERWLAALAAPLTAPRESDEEWDRYEREHERSPVSQDELNAAALRCTERGSGRARVWALEHVGSLGVASGVEDLRRRLFEQLLERHVDEPYISTFAQEPERRFNIRGYAPSWECMLSQLAERTQVAATAAALHFALARAFDRYPPEVFETPDPSDACLRHLRAALSGPLSEDKERIAQGMLFAREHLLEGQLLPNVQAVDTDGVPFQLADYRGRVTLIVFWGFWCGPCRKELPMLARLAKRFEDRAFALLGVATDDDLEFWHAEAARSGVSWRNAWTGTTREGWPVSWGVTGYPRMLLVGSDGRVARKYSWMRMVGACNGEDLQLCIERMLASDIDAALDLAQRGASSARSRDVGGLWEPWMGRNAGRPQPRVASRPELPNTDSARFGGPEIGVESESRKR